MIRRTVHNLRQRPHDERRFFALVFAACFVGVLFVIWAFFFLRQIRDEMLANATAATSTAAAAEEEPMRTDQLPSYFNGGASGSLDAGSASTTTASTTIETNPGDVLY